MYKTFTLEILLFRNFNLLLLDEIRYILDVLFHINFIHLLQLNTIK